MAVSPRLELELVCWFTSYLLLTMYFYLLIVTVNYIIVVVLVLLLTMKTQKNFEMKKYISKF